MNLLLTGFGPFPGVTKNPSGQLAEALAAAPPAGLEVHAAVLPVSFAGAPRALEQHVAAHAASGLSLLLAMGVHPGAGFRLERRARAQPKGGRPDVEGQVGAASRATRERSTSLDLEALQRALGLSAGPLGGLVISEDAGGYVCDWTYQHLLRLGAELGVPALFLHVPPLERLGLERQRGFVEQLLAELASGC